jgi:hypothetical protein
MSKIVSPYPTLQRDPIVDPQALWWRLKLQPNRDGNLVVMQMDPTADVFGGGNREPQWVSWEIFDGYDTLIDAGLDKPTVAEIRLIDNRGSADVYHNHTFISRLEMWLDALHTEPPTPSDRWRALTSPGDFIHPDDAPHCTPSRSEARRHWWTHR